MMDVQLGNNQRAESVRDCVLVRAYLSAQLVRVYGGDDSNEVLKQTCVVPLSNDAMHWKYW